MALDLTIDGGPIFASRSHVNEETRKYGTFLVSSGENQALLRRIFDGDPRSTWLSVSADDLTQVDIDLSFQLRTAAISRTVDLIALQNINWKRFRIQYSNTGAAPFTTIPEFDYTGSDNTATDIIKEISSITANFLHIEITSTINADEKKQLGGIYACESKLQFSRGMVRDAKRYRENVRRLQLGDGSESEEQVRRSATSFQHYESTPGFDFVTKAERDTLFELKDDGDPLTWIPEPFDVPRDVFTVRMRGPWADQYQTPFKGNGYRINLTLSEAGRL